MSPAGGGGSAQAGPRGGLFDYNFGCGYAALDSTVSNGTGIADVSSRYWAISVPFVTLPQIAG
jgi:hypothetical protein